MICLFAWQNNADRYTVLALDTEMASFFIFLLFSEKG